MDKFEKLILDERLAPLMTSDETLLKLPRTHISVSEFDPLRDDGVCWFDYKIKFCLLNGQMLKNCHLRSFCSCHLVIDWQCGLISKIVESWRRRFA